MNRMDFEKAKREGRKLSMITAYDHWSARIVDQTEIDCVLVGDSLAMVVHGFPSTVHATPEMMALHVAAVARGAKSKFIVGDMPFLSFRKGLAPAMDCVDQLMKAGAHSVKLEGVWGHEEVIEGIVRSGVPVMGHIGLTPQSIHQLGGFRIQGREKEAASDLMKQAKRLEELGSFAIVLECVPTALAQEITANLRIPTIGIGAGPYVDGQVLVMQDLLGMNHEFKPKFVRHFHDGEKALRDAFETFDRSVKDGSYPKPEESYA